MSPDHVPADATSKGRLLFVDDERASRELYKVMFAKGLDAWKVECADSGSAALRLMGAGAV